MEELRGRRDQLQAVLEQLDWLAREVDQVAETDEAEKRLLSLHRLTARNVQLEEELEKEKGDNIKRGFKLEALEKQNRLLENNVENISKENNKLQKLAQKRDEDNETISNVLEKISCDYEQLQKAFASQKYPKDDKIQALRNTAKALEAENELLQEEKAIKARDNTNIHNNLLSKLTKIEQTCQAQKEQIDHFEKETALWSERYGRLEEEKINVLREMTKVERALEGCEDQVVMLRQDNADMHEKRTDADERLDALKDCKRVVELKYHNNLMEKSSLENKIVGLNQSNELMQVKNQSLEERLRVLECEKEEQTEICAEIQQNLIQKTSEYETTIQRMQLELDSRIDELDVTKKDDVDKVKNHYFELFHEKASEVSSVRTELEACEKNLESYKAKCSDLEYREQELSDLVDKIRSNPEQSKDHADIKGKLDEYLSENTRLQERIHVIRKSFDQMKENEQEMIIIFATRSEEMSALLSEKDGQIMQLNSDVKSLSANSNKLSNSSQPSPLETKNPKSHDISDEKSPMLNGEQHQNMKKKKRRKKSKVL